MHCAVVHNSCSPRVLNLAKFKLSRNSIFVGYKVSQRYSARESHFVPRHLFFPSTLVSPRCGQSKYKTLRGGHSVIFATSAHITMGGYTFGETVVAGDKTVEHTATMIFLHGLGDTGHGWAQGISGMGLKGLKVVCPTAPTQPVTLNGGLPMPAWFDLPPMGPQLLSQIDWKGVEASIKYTHALIDEEVKSGVKPENIILGGFSQGGSIAIRAALQYPKTLAGAVVLSSFVGPTDDLQVSKLPPANIKMKMFWGHGETDPMVPMMFGQMGAQALKQLGVALEWKSYSGLGHSSSPEEMRDVKKFISNLFPASASSSVPPPTEEQINSMSVKELKAFLQSKSVNFAGCFEKSELLTLAKSSL